MKFVVIWYDLFDSLFGSSHESTLSKRLEIAPWSLHVNYRMINIKRGDESDVFAPHAVKNLSNSIPSLLDKFTEVEKLSSEIDPNNNISYNIMRIKELIEQARSAANRVSGFFWHVILD